MNDYINILQTARKVFVYANEHNWQGLIDEVFDDTVATDDSSYPGGPPAMILSATQQVENWKSVIPKMITHHQMGNELVNIAEDHAHVHAYVTAYHIKPELTENNKWTVVSSFEIMLRRTDIGWRVTGLKQHFKFQEGNPLIATMP